MFTHQIEDLLLNDKAFREEFPQDCKVARPADISQSIIQRNENNVQPLLGIIGNVEGDHLRSEVKAAIKELAANNSDTTQ